MTETAAIVRRDSQAIQLEQERTSLLKRTLVAAGVPVSDDELHFAIAYAQARGLDPWSRQVHITKVRGRLVIMDAIAGIRKLAIETGEFQGIEGPWFKAQGERDWRDTWDEQEPPYAGKIVVHRRGQLPRTFVGYFDECVQRGDDGRPRGQWGPSPLYMFGIALERRGVRAVFPDETVGLVSIPDADGGEITTEITVMDRDGPTTRRQIGKLHELAKELGWSDDERRARAGVGSFAEIRQQWTRGETNDLINEWSELRENSEPGEPAALAEVTGEGTKASVVEDTGSEHHSRAAASTSSNTVDDGEAESVEPPGEASPEGGDPSAEPDPGQAAADVMTPQSPPEGEVAQPKEDPTIEDGPYRGYRFSAASRTIAGREWLTSHEAQTGAKKRRSLAEAWAAHGEGGGEE